MNQLDIIFPESAPKAVSLEPESPKPVRQFRPKMLQGKDGRIAGYVPRTQSQMEQDFWERVKIGGPDECWEWQRAFTGKTGNQYGVVWFNGKRWKTHVFSYTITYGPVAKGICVCHHCDNPKCCNPKHLFAGTMLDNVSDMISKGRDVRERGEDRYNATLTEDDIREIRKRWQFRDKQNGTTALAAEFGVGPTMISAIIHRNRWKHVA